jgi:hypothetical protein
VQPEGRTQRNSADRTEARFLACTFVRFTREEIRGLKELIDCQGGVFPPGVRVPPEDHAGSEWPSILETAWSGTPWRRARAPAV